MNSITRETVDLIRSYEGLRLKAYQDSVGVWTIGYGHTAGAGLPHPSAGMQITEEQAVQILTMDLLKFAGYVSDAIAVPINDNQFGAMLSFTYNLGPAALHASTLLKKVNAKDFAGAAEEFAKWNKADGKVLSGLTRRRAAEAALFRKPVTLSVPTEPPAPAPVPPINKPVTPSPVVPVGIGATVIAAGTALAIWWHDLVAWVYSFF